MKKCYTCGATYEGNACPRCQSTLFVEPNTDKNVMRIASVRELVALSTSLANDIQSIERALKQLRNDDWQVDICKDERAAVKVLYNEYKQLTSYRDDFHNTKVSIDPKIFK